MSILSITKERLRLATDRIENEIVRPQISEINISFIWQLVYLAVLLISGILTNLNLSWNSVLGTIGLGSLSVKSIGKTASESWEKFRKDRRTLMTSLTDLKAHLDLCSEDDESCLKDVESKIRQYLEEAKK